MQHIMFPGDSQPCVRMLNVGLDRSIGVLPVIGRRRRWALDIAHTKPRAVLMMAIVPLVVLYWVVRGIADHAS